MALALAGQQHLARLRRRGSGAGRGPPRSACRARRRGGRRPCGSWPRAPRRTAAGAAPAAAPRVCGLPVVDRIWPAWAASTLPMAQTSPIGGRGDLLDRRALHREEAAGPAALAVRQHEVGAVRPGPCRTPGRRRACRTGRRRRPSAHRRRPRSRAARRRARAGGVSWRSAFSRRRTPKPFCAEPKNTGTIRPSFISRTRSAKTASRLGVTSESSCSSSSSSKSAICSSMWKRASASASRRSPGISTWVEGSFGPVDEGALQRQVDEAGDLLAVPGRDLARDQRRGADRRQRGQQVGQRAAGQVHLVDEEGVRHAQPLQLAQRRLQQGGLGRVGLGDHDGQVDGRQGGVEVGAEFQGAGAVDHRIAVAHEVEAGEVQLHRMAAGARLGAGVADLLAADAPIDGAGDLQQGFHQGGLAGAGGAHERQSAHGPRWSGLAWFVSHHPWAPGTRGPVAADARPWRGFGTVADRFRGSRRPDGKTLRPRVSGGVRSRTRGLARGIGWEGRQVSASSAWIERSSSIAPGRPARANATSSSTARRVRRLGRRAPAAGAVQPQRPLVSGPPAGWSRRARRRDVAAQASYRVDRRAPR